MSAIRVELPHHLRTLAGVRGEVTVEVVATASIKSVMDTVEERYPMLRGTIREYGSLQRRAFLRFFVCGEDWSHKPADSPLPQAVVTGREPLLIIGAIAGGC